MNSDGRIPPVASSSSSSSSASKSDPLVGEYDVFLSFCGKDTRNGFTDFLYVCLQDAGVRTFRDDNELRVGEEIGRELLKAIKGSKISIPIFSKSYASSKWCLLELAKMVQCQEEYGGQKIFPIFYNVDPYEVQHQSNGYEEAFRQYRKRRFDEKTVQEWKKALEKVGRLKGLELKKETGGREGKLVKIIKDQVLEFLNQNYKHEDTNLVGMPHRIEKIGELLNIHSNGVRFIGIHGMGGLGKTTIAEVLYYKYRNHFECHGFLKDVRETSKSPNGIVLLQNQLCSEILRTKISDIRHYREGIRKIKDAVCGKKVLIVLDDVDEKSQIDKLAGSYEWFGAESRVIITTRNNEVLCAIQQTLHREGHPEVYENYKPELMDDDESLELFSKYAFESKSPPKDYYDISRKIVSTAAGLPLVLVVTGSSLSGETEKDLWEEKFKELKNIPAEEVLEKLRLSFDPLNYAQKEIFLDIACLFIGKDKTNRCYMWDDCGFHPRIVLNVLVRRSLITVGDDNILGMHDQLRDLGRQIACEGKLDECRKWSRLWQKDKALEVYMTGQGTENVKALSLDFQCRYFKDQALGCLVGEKFKRLSNLRYLTMKGFHLDGDFKDCLPNLRWLQWHGFEDCLTSLRWDGRCRVRFTATNFCLWNLVILDLFGCEITDDSNFWTQIKMSKKLKVLEIHDCTYLTRVPSLSTFSNLERLNVFCCHYLRSLDGIEELESLKYSDVSKCTLETLPNLSRLRKVVQLNLTSCTLIDIPGLDKLESLEYLNMMDCRSLERLPDLSNLMKLKGLYVSHCTKLTEIRGLGRLESLEFLDICHYNGRETVFDLSNLKRLRVLRAWSCRNLNEIHGLEGLESLEVLLLAECCSLRRLPDLSNLKKRLDVSSRSALIKIQGQPNFGMLKKIDLWFKQKK